MKEVEQLKKELEECERLWPKYSCDCLYYEMLYLEKQIIIMNLKNHTDLLNYLISRYRFESYLEIGVQHKVNFNLIKVIDGSKLCVDPDPQSGADFIMTSDEYFESHPDAKHDIVFIDGDHTKEQVQKDFENAIDVLSRNGMIVLHDTNPELEIRTKIPRETKQWNGDVYNFACQLHLYNGIDFKTFEFDHGCTVIWLKDIFVEKPEIERFIDWENFQKEKEILLKINNELPTQPW